MAIEPLLLTRSHCLKITRDGLIVCFNFILSLLSAIYSHRRMGVYAGFHIANVDPDGLYVTLVILTCGLVAQYCLPRRFCCPYIRRNSECCSSCSTGNFSFSSLYFNHGLAPSNFNFFRHSLREWYHRNRFTSPVGSGVPWFTWETWDARYLVDDNCRASKWHLHVN